MTDETIDPDNPDHHKKIDVIMSNALADVFRDKFDGTYVTKFVMLVEVMDKEGKQSMWEANSPDLGVWEMLGFLEFGKMVTHRMIAAADDDD